ncbi:cyclin-T1-2-like isoform X2 [Diospyros lotus]|nr:cyclin-T1-2-like isoform X2 [Diospyros lotus]
MLCHRFYMRQSHAKNDWQIIATVSIFLACKSEDTPRKLRDVVVVAYKLIYRWDPSAPRRIRQSDVLAKQEELILTGERVFLSTIAFDLNVQLPYQPLVAVLKRLDISNKELARVAWSLVNDWLYTTLCLQYKPHCVAAGSLFLAAKFLNVKLPTERGNVWWFQFEVSPKQLEAVVHDMLCLLEKKWKPASPPVRGRGVESKTAMPNIPQPAVGSDSGSMSRGSTIGGFVNSATSINQESGITSVSSVAEGTVPIATANSDRLIKSATPSTPLSCFVTSSNACRCTAQGAVVGVNHAMAKFSESGAYSHFNCRRKESLFCQPSTSGSANSAVEDGDGQPKSQGSDQNPGFKIVSVRGGCIKLDVNRIGDLLKKRKGNRTVNKKLAEASDDEIERELEDGIELQWQAASKNKKMRF